MEKYRKHANLAEQTFIGPYSFEQQTEEFKKNIKIYIELLKKIGNCDFNILNDLEFYNLICEFYDIYLDENDYFQMLAQYYNKEYIGIYTIRTTMTYKAMTTEGFHKSFDWWEQQYQVCYDIIGSNQFNYDYNKIYSKREIKRLIANKDIVIINEKAKAIDNHTSFSKQKYEPMPSLNIDFSDGSNHISKFIYDNFKLFGELLRNIFTKRVVLNDIKDFLNELNEEIRIVFSDSKSKKFVHYVTASMCKEWYESSKEKEDIQNIQRKLSPSKKMRG